MWDWRDRLRSSTKRNFYLIGREYWGNGYAKEATRVLLEYSFNTIGLNKVIAVVHPNNIASIKVIEAMGLKYQNVVEGLAEEFDFYNGSFCYGLTKDEYLK